MASAAARLLYVIRLVAAKWKEARALHAFFLHDHGHAHGGKSALFRDKVKRVAKGRLVQFHAKASEHIVARARGLHAAFKINKAKVAHQFQMRLWFEATLTFKTFRRIKVRRVPAANFFVVLGARSNRNIGGGRLRNTEH